VLAVWLACWPGGMQLLVGLTRSAWVLNLVTSPGARRLQPGRRAADHRLATALR
jgi:hypothetical protein